MAAHDPLLQTGSKARWGEINDDLDDFDADINQEITTESVNLPDGSMLKTVVEFKTNEKGQTVKVIKKIKVRKIKVKVNKRVEYRKKNWRKFGEAANAKGPEPGITMVGDEVFIDMVAGAEQEKAIKKDAVNLGIICRHCGKTGDHWTLKCPFLKSGLPPVGATGAEEEKPNARRELGGTGKYVPPGALRSSSSGSAPVRDEARDGRQRDELATVRVTNLSEDTKEQDLQELFRRFGPISRIYLAKDKNTGLSKGFAFVNFVYRDDAAKAIEKVSGFGYDHLILHLEWAKPSK